MNAAYLMLSMCLAGGDPAPVAASGSCCGGCNNAATSCNSCDPCAKKPGLFARLCSKKSDCGCESSCAPAPTCNTCNTCTKCKAPRQPKAPKCKPAKSCCDAAPACNTCNHDCDPCGKKPGLFARLFAKKSDCGCDSACGCSTGSNCGCTSGCGGAISAPASTPAPAEAVPVKPTTPAKPMTLQRIITPVTPVAAPF